MFILYANKNRLIVRQREPVTSGSKNVSSVRFEFSAEWEGLTRTAIFRAGTESRAALLGEDNETVIPWEVLRQSGLELFCGVYGTQGGHTVLPTIWASLGMILAGASPGEPAQPPTPDLWQQELARKGDGLRYDGLNLSLLSGDNPLATVQVAGGGGYVPVPGPQGVQGPKGEQGDPGSDATINGKNAITLAAGQNVTIETGDDGTVTISAAGGGSGESVAAGDELSKDGDTLSVDNPVRGILTQAEFDALPEEQKTKGTYFVDDGELLEGITIDDYDTDDGWHVRKWSDGYIEQFISVSQKVTGFINIDPMTYTQPYVDPIIYPVPFVIFLGISVDYYGRKNRIMTPTWFRRNDNLTAFLTQTPSICLLGYDDGFLDVEVTYLIRAFGFWK